MTPAHGGRARLPRRHEGLRIRFVLAADLVNDLVPARARNALGTCLTARGSHDLVLSDERGHPSSDSGGADLLGQVFDKR